MDSRTHAHMDKRTDVHIETLQGVFGYCGSRQDCETMVRSIGLTVSSTGRITTSTGTVVGHITGAEEASVVHPPLSLWQRLKQWMRQDTN